MVNGKFHGHPAYPDALQVSKWRWWFAKITGGEDLRAWFF
jgi:hypothetical protein